MWEAEIPGEEDPLRQGDLIRDVVFPSMKLPLPSYSVGALQQTSVETRTEFGLVVSHCCDNANGKYAAVAPVRPRGGLQPHQEEALLRSEPTWEGFQIKSYNIENFWIQPLPGQFEPPEGKHYAAALTRMVTMYGDCSEFQARRIARMTVAGRRLLRINLGLLWSRVEEEDAQALEAAGLPVGLADPPTPDPTGT